MRIAYICADPGVPVFGHKGCSIHVQCVIQTLLQQGHEVELFAARIGGSAPPMLADVWLHRLPKLPKGKTQAEIAEREISALSANLDLRIALESRGPFDLVYERYSLWSCTGMEYAQSSNIPAVLEVNAPLIEEQSVHRGLVNQEEAKRMTQRALNASSVIVAVSAEVANYVTGFEIQPSKIHVIANGVDPERYPLEIKAIHPKSDPEFVVGFVGTMKPWHDLPTLVKAFGLFHQAHPQARLLMVGDGPTRADIEAEAIAHSSPDAVIMPGLVPPEHIPGYLASMDVAVAPYAAQAPCYFSPLKVYEAMAAGLPVVASETGQLAQLLQHGQNGMLYPPGDATALAEVLQYLWQTPQLRQQIGQKAREQVLSQHTWDVIVRQILELAHQTLIAPRVEVVN